MRKITFLLMGVLLSLALVNIAHADLLLNPGFEAGGANWTLGESAVVVSNASRAHSGSYYGEVGLNQSGSFFQNFLLPGPVETLEFGAYIKIFANYLGGNIDQVQISMQVVGQSGNVLGGSVADYNPILFTQIGPLWETNWFLLSGTLDVPVGDAIAGINIKLQAATIGGSSAPITGIRVDDAFAQAAPAPVPEPGTMMLLGSGLVGLVGYGRRKFKK